MSATPPRDTTDTERLADLISIGAHEAIRPGEWKTLAAKTVLASDWLATRDAALRAEAWDEGHLLGEVLAYNAVGDILYARHQDVMGRSAYREAKRARLEAMPHWGENPYRLAGGAL